MILMELELLINLKIVNILKRTYCDLPKLYAQASETLFLALALHKWMVPFLLCPQNGTFLGFTLLCKTYMNILTYI